MSGRIAASTKVARGTKKLRAGFYFLKDQAGHQTTRPQAIAELVKEANRILASAGIELVGSTRDCLPVPEDLGKRIDFASSARVASGAKRGNHYYQLLLYNIRENNPDPFSVFFVWDFESPQPGLIASAFTWRKDRQTICVMRDDIPKPGRILAHEAGHALGVDYNTEDALHLMHEYDMPGTGTYIPGDQADTMRASPLLD